MPISTRIDTDRLDAISEMSRQMLKEHLAGMMTMSSDEIHNAMADLSAVLGFASAFLAAKFLRGCPAEEYGREFGEFVTGCIKDIREKEGINVNSDRKKTKSVWGA